MNSHSNQAKVDKLFTKHISKNLYPHDLIAFSDDILALLAAERQALVEEIIKGLPEPDTYAGVNEAAYAGALGFNDCLDEIKQLLSGYKGGE